MSDGRVVRNEVEGTGHSHILRGLADHSDEAWLLSQVQRALTEPYEEHGFHNQEITKCLS